MNNGCYGHQAEKAIRMKIEPTLHAPLRLPLSILQQLTTSETLMTNAAVRTSLLVAESRYQEPILQILLLLIRGGNFKPFINERINLGLCPHL